MRNSLDTQDEEIMAQRKYSKKKKAAADSSKGTLKLVIFTAVAVFLEVCLFNILGNFGGWIRYGLLGVFGLAAYLFPILIIILSAYVIMSRDTKKSKVVCFIVLFVMLSVFLHLVSFADYMDYSPVEYFRECAVQVKGGGIAGGTLAYGLTRAVGKTGAYVVTIIAALGCLTVITEVLTFFKEWIPEEREKDKREGGKIVKPVKKDREKEFYPDGTESLRRPGRDRRVERQYPDDEDTVYTTKDENGVVIRIVQTNKKIKRPRVPLKRSFNRAQPLRSDNVRPLGDRPKSIGVSTNVDIASQTASPDEVREITKKQPENGGGQVMPLIPRAQKAETPKKTAAAKTQIAKAGPNLKREEKKPAQKVTSETKITPEKKKAAPASSAGYKYPPLELLARRRGREKGRNEAELDRVARNLEIILANFGVEAKVIDRQSGPSVTRYELQPEMGTRVSKITKLEDDIKLNLAVSDIRIEAPIPGRAAIGIEIPNADKEMVLMRELLEAPDLMNHKSKIAFAAGKDISGDVIVSDIAKMPHLLVAGTTGSGKSTFVNTIIMAILYRAKPSEVGLIVIDPKKIEFGVYSGIPHLVKDVVTDPGQAVSTLRWAVNEMENRYQRMQLSGVRDFKSYNDKLDKGTLSKEEENPKRMPQIVIIIDELADLMMVASKEAEALICRLAQLARAAGIHLIIATQRPSVDVVTGLIKANIPARVALLVASQVDSRTIIDMKGAEELLGNGDMLFYPTGYSKPVRVQGAFISEEEVANVVRFLKKNKQEEFFAEESRQIEEYINNPAARGSSGGGADAGGDDGRYDEYLYEAGMACIEAGKASSSMLQRRFSIGFNRAARIIDQLAEMGAIGPVNGSKPREILVDVITFEEMYNSQVQ